MRVVVRDVTIAESKNALRVEEDGRRRMAVNARLAEPAAVAHIPIDHFDGFDTFEDLPRSGRCMRDYLA